MDQTGSGAQATGVSAETHNERRCPACSAACLTATCDVRGICCWHHVLSSVRRVSVQLRELDRCLRVSGQTWVSRPSSPLQGDCHVSCKETGSGGPAACPREWRAGWAPGPCCPPRVEPGALRPLVLAVPEKQCGQPSLCWSRAGPVPPAAVLSRTPVSLPLPGPWPTRSCTHEPTGPAQESGGRCCLSWDLVQHPREEE